MTREGLVVLLVDDDADVAAMTSRLLGARGIHVAWTSTSFGACNLARRLQPDVVLLDIQLPGLSGDALVGLLRRSAPATLRVVLYSSQDDESLRTIARRTGADGWISKSADSSKLVQYLTRIVRLGGHEA